MENTAIVAEWHNPNLQEMRTSPNAAAIGTETKEENLLTSGRPQAGIYSKIPLPPLPTLK